MLKYNIVRIIVWFTACLIPHYSTSWKSTLCELYLSRKTASMFLPKETQIDIQFTKFLQGKNKKFFPLWKEVLGLSKDSSLKVCHHRPGQEESRTRPMILYQVPHELLESTFPQKVLSRTHLKHHPSLWSDTLIFFLPITATEHLCFFLQVQLEWLLLMYTALSQMRTKGHGAIYTVIKLQRSVTKVHKGNSQVNKTEMSISVTSIAEFI